ncbi:hypothetical protein BGX28_008805 [Mortierella sp. GBA30]|nr:hypothetical protein BGX28_008805 [Mortierella sp. GBA30]
MAMDASLTTIFDIPLILDEINNDLTVNEVWACSQVCRLWRALFEPYLWRSVILLRSNDPQTPTTFLNGVETNDLLQKARWIRILAIEIWDTTFADSQDLDLIELISVDNVYYTDDNQADTVEDSSSSLDLIANNPGLRSILSAEILLCPCELDHNEPHVRNSTQHQSVTDRGGIEALSLNITGTGD